MQIANLQLQHLEEDISEAFLQRFCATYELGSICHLQIHVDTLVQSVDRLGMLLPSLLALNLTGSVVGSLRELGSGLQRLEVLWMGRCALQDIGSVTGMQCLREFYMPFNDVVDLSPLSFSETLEVLDIEGNAVEDIQEIECITSCWQLRELTLRENPLCKSLSYSRNRVLDMLPQVEVLDDVSRWPESSDVQESRVAMEEDLLSDVDSNLGEPVPPIEPLQPTHPLLAAALEEMAHRTPREQHFPSEPDEEELILKRLKKPAVAEPGIARGASSSFPFHPMARNQDLAAPPAKMHAPKGTVSAASDLTCGNSLAGNPLSVARQRRHNRNTPVEAGMDILTLISRQEACLQSEPQQSSKVSSQLPEAAGARPCTPDVRVRALPSAGDLRRPPLAQAARTPKLAADSDGHVAPKSAGLRIEAFAKADDILRRLDQTVTPEPRHSCWAPPLAPRLAVEPIPGDSSRPPTPPTVPRQGRGRPVPKPKLSEPLRKEGLPTLTRCASAADNGRKLDGGRKVLELEPGAWATSPTTGAPAQRRKNRSCGAVSAQLLKQCVAATTVTPGFLGDPYPQLDCVSRSFSAVKTSASLLGPSFGPGVEALPCLFAY
jgi:hypothetical protein